MSSHTITVTGYLLVVAAVAALQVVALTHRTSIPTLGAVLSRLMQSRSGRVGVLAGWAWIGLHFFVR